MNQGNEKTGPTKRIHHRMTSVREFLIIYGGYDTKNHTECNELWRYDTIRGVWKRYQPPIEIKDRCVFSTICTLGNLVYIFGGESFNNIHRQTNCLVSFDISNAAWKILSPHIDEYDENTPPPMSRNLLCSNKGSLYVLQGYSKYGKLYTLYKFCLRTLTWSLVEQHGPAPLYIAGIFGTVYKNKLYCFGGSSVEIKKFYHIAIFDISTNIWTITAMVSKNQQYPDQRTFESFAFSGKFGYMSGGKIFGTETYFYDIWRIDLAALEWLKLDYSLRRDSILHLMSIVDDSYLYSLEVFSLNPGCLNPFERCPLRLPSLYRLCLEYISRPSNMRSYIMSLPSSIEDDLNFDNDSSLDT